MLIKVKKFIKVTKDTDISDNIGDGKSTQPKGYEIKPNGNPDLPVVQGPGPITTPGNYPCPRCNNTPPILEKSAKSGNIYLVKMETNSKEF